MFFYSRKVSDIFEDLNESTFPIAAASLGQVYKLKLKHGNKETVAVKVQVITVAVKTQAQTWQQRNRWLLKFKYNGGDLNIGLV